MSEEKYVQAMCKYRWLREGGTRATPMLTFDEPAHPQAITVENGRFLHVDSISEIVRPEIKERIAFKYIHGKPCRYTPQ